MRVVVFFKSFYKTAFEKLDIYNVILEFTVSSEKRHITQTTRS